MTQAILASPSLDDFEDEFIKKPPPAAVEAKPTEASGGNPPLPATDSGHPAEVVVAASAPIKSADGDVKKSPRLESPDVVVASDTKPVRILLRIVGWTDVFSS